MKQMEQSEFMASQQLKKMIPQLLLSVSLFSFVFSYSSFYSSSSLVYSPKFHFYFSGNSFQLLTNALNKNCLFLICNGLLVFLSKTSGLIRPPASQDLDDVMQKRIGDTLQTALEKYVLEEVTRETKEDEEEEEKEKTGEGTKEVSIFIAESEEEGGGACDDEEKDEDQPDQTRNCWLFNDDDDEQQLCGEEVEEEEDDDEVREELSTEELNQKFEDFIRKMKEEIIINEARQKVVMIK